MAEFPKVTYTKKNKLQDTFVNGVKTGEVWTPDIPQEIPIKTLPDGTQINMLTNQVRSPTGEISVLQDARAQAKNPEAGIIQYGGMQGAGKVIGNERSQQDLNYLQAISKAQLPQNQELPQTQEKTFGQKAAEIGVTPAVTAANLISKGWKLLTGSDLGQITTEQFAATDIGKILGTATDIAGLGVIGSGAFAVLGGAEGISAGMGALTGGGAAAVPTAEGVATITKAAVIKNGLLARAIHSRILQIGVGVFIGGRVSTLPERMANDAKAAITSTVQTAELINDGVKAGIISPQDALLQYQTLDAQINSLERDMKSWSHGLKNFLGGGKDNLVDIQNAKMNLQLKRTALINAIYGIK